MPMSAVTTCTQTSASIKVPLQTGHVLKNLRVKSGTAGVNASSGVVTVMVNSATSTGLTCTVGTGTTCSDLVDTYTVAGGDVFYVQFTTQALETLGSVAVSFEVL
jgi:hypothetical protein